MSKIMPYRPIELMVDPKLTKSDFTDFIGVWENFVPKAFCEKLIYFCDGLISEHGCYIASEENSTPESIAFSKGEEYGGNIVRKDSSFMLNYADSTLSYQVNQFLLSCANHYIEEYSQLKRIGLLSTDIKVQKTSPGGGYHAWHYESASTGMAYRELVWMIYLNDMPDGEGETEFLYQRRRIKPTAGTVVMFPAGLTHVHKGNTVFTQDKYIVTGWYIKTN